MCKKIEKKVLVVDDEPDVRNYLKSALENFGFLVRTAVDGLDGLEKVKEDVPDLISLDLVMPQHSGIKFYHELQKDKILAKIPVLIVTGHARDDLGKVDFETLMMQGPGVYLEKPVKPNNYIEKVCQLLNIEPPDEILNSTEENTEELKSKLSKSLEGADVDTLKKALELINQKNK